MLLEMVFQNVKITLPECSEQIGNHDCGLFAIAFCTALAYGVPLHEVNILCSIT